MGREGHAELVSRAFTMQAEAFNSSAVANDAGLLDAILEEARPEGSERWLELACGPGVISRRLAPLVESVHGIDITPAMITVARREAASEGIANATFELGDAVATGLGSSEFDGVITRFSVHHLPVPARLFAEAARLLHPGGKLVIADHLADEDPEARAWAQEIERLRDPSHWAGLTANQLRALGDRAGFELERERQTAFELDFDDWLRRGTADSDARALVALAVADRPGGSRCFALGEQQQRRTLMLQMWLGCFRRP
jgi:SAM-dependent methyltransferase